MYCTLNLTHIYYSYLYTRDLHVLLIVIWLIFTTHYLYTRFTCIVLNLTHIYYSYYLWLTCATHPQFDSYLLPITCIHMLHHIATLNLTHIYYPLLVIHAVTCIVLNLTHMYYPLPQYDTCVLLYCSQFDSYVLLILPVWHMCTCIVSQFDSYLLPIVMLTHMLHVLHSQFDSYLLPLPVYTFYMYCSHSNLTHMYYPLPVYTFYMYCSQFDSYLLPITCIHVLHVLFSIWLICTTHYLWYTCYMYCSQFDSYLLPITCIHDVYMYCSQFDSYVLPITCIHVLHVLFSIWLICTTHYLYTHVTFIVLNLTHIYYP